MFGRLGKIVVAGAVADPLDFHGGHQAERIDQDGQNGGAGGRGQLTFDRRFLQRNAAEQLGRGGGGNAALAVGDLDPADPRRNRRGHDVIHPEQLPADRGPDDVGDRIGGTNLMEVDFVDRSAVYAGLGPGQGVEEPASGIPLPHVQLTRVDHRQDVAQVTFFVFRFAFDADLGRPKAQFCHFGGPQPQAGQSQRADGPVDRLQIDAGVDQCRQRHVAADSVAAIEIGYPGHKHPHYGRSCFCITH